LGLPSLTMTSLSLLLAVVAEEAGSVKRVSWRCSSSDPFGPGRDPGKGLCRCMIDYNFDNTAVFRERWPGEGVDLVELVKGSPKTTAVL
jgi:hypothetical protein